jgi:fructokinase
MFSAHASAASMHAALAPSRAHARRARALRLGSPPARPLRASRRGAFVPAAAAASDERVTVIGEALWDSMPDGLFLGGAPANVACHLNELGRAPTVVSRVGDDELGREVLRRLSARGLDTSRVQIDDGDVPTGFVVVTMDGEMPSYDIVRPSAWDKMAATQELIEAARDAVVVYGSLAQRDETSRKAIEAAARAAGKRVFDVNLRAPFIDPESCVEHARRCWLLKLNDDELPEMYAWCGLDGVRASKESNAWIVPMACALKEVLECENLCVTRGGDGAALISSSGQVTQHPGFVVRAVDTVGSGDSFLATLLDALLSGESPAASLERACRVGAYVATQRGATPRHDRSAIDALVSK